MRGYKEEGSTTTPFDMTVRNDLDRFHLVKDVAERVPKLAPRAAHVAQAMREKLMQHHDVHLQARRGHARDQRLALGRDPLSARKICGRSPHVAGMRLALPTRMDPNQLMKVVLGAELFTLALRTAAR